MQPGKLLINKEGFKRKILAVCGELFALSDQGMFDHFTSRNWWTKKEMEEDGFSLLEEPWMPTEGDAVWLVTDAGGFHQFYWNSEDDFCKYRLSIGNVHRIKVDAELYKQKLIERMGRKEN